MRSMKFRCMVWGALMIVCCALTAYAADAPVLQIKTAKPGVAVEIDRLVGAGKAVVSAADEEGKPLFGLGIADFEVSLGGRSAEVTSVQPLAESLDVPRHIVMVLDNSDSMRQREAINALLASIDDFLKNIRPIDDVQIVTFSGKKTVSMAGRTLHVKVFKSNQPADIKAHIHKVYKEGITSGTYLYEGMFAAVELARRMPASDPQFMVVFSDGEDLNSSVKRDDVLKAAKGAGRLNAYAVDYMPSKEIDDFLKKFTTGNHGQVYKAASESNFLSIFQNVATKMQYYYVLAYAFPLTGKLTVAPEGVIIEELKTIDASPLLGHIFFSEGSSTIPSSYATFAAPGETAGFDDQKFTDTLAKYYQVLNIIGKRLADMPEEKIVLVGCNSDTGKEKGRKKLSAQRAEAVREYLQTVWNIAPERMKVEARALPAMPSAKWQAQGQAENRRVEIRADNPAIVAPVRSVYLATRINATALAVRSSEIVPAEIAGWKTTVANTAGTLAELSGKGAPAPDQQVDLPVKDLKALADGGDISVKMELKGTMGQAQVLSSAPVKVSFVQTSQRSAEKQDQKVQEKYALILFDFDKDTISPVNQVIVDRVAGRVKDLPGATVKIVGHTDNTGKEAYNAKLSQRRALAVYKMLAAACGPEAKDRISHEGVGPKTPLYDNTTPEARAFNRTVTITLEYMSAE